MRVGSTRASISRRTLTKSLDRCCFLVCATIATLSAASTVPCSGLTSAGSARSRAPRLFVMTRHRRVVLRQFAATLVLRQIVFGGLAAAYFGTALRARAHPRTCRPAGHGVRHRGRRDRSPRPHRPPGGPTDLRGVDGGGLSDRLDHLAGPARPGLLRAVHAAGPSVQTRGSRPARARASPQSVDLLDGQGCADRDAELPPAILRSRAPIQCDGFLVMVNPMRWIKTRTRWRETQ